MWGSAADCMTLLGIPTGDQTEAARIAIIMQSVNDAIEHWCDRKFCQKTYLSDFYSGTGTSWLLLRQRPVTAYMVTGTTVVGSPIITGLANPYGQAPNYGLIVGMPVNSPYFPPGTTVLTVGTTTVTVRQSATGAGTQPISVGMAIWCDQNGFWGAGNQFDPAPFASATQLFEGQDYNLSRDQPDGSSLSGMVYSQDGWWPANFEYTPGRISPLLISGLGNILVQYTAGYPQVPGDVLYALYKQVAAERNSKNTGQLLTSESRSDTTGSNSYGVGGRTKVGFLTPEVTGILGAYRNVSVA